MPARILVVEDDPNVADSLAMVLEYEGYAVVAVATGEAGLDELAAAPADLVILDVNLPGIDGMSACKRMRTDGFAGPVLMLTARHEVRDRVEGLDSGADDYLAKPFALAELLARVRALLRREGTDTGTDGTTAAVGDLVVDAAARRAWRAGHSVELTKREFDLLELLVANAGTVLTRDDLHRTVWGYDEDLGSNSLEVFVSALRRKTEADGLPRLIHTVRGVGYVAREELR